MKHCCGRIMDVVVGPSGQLLMNVPSLLSSPRERKHLGVIWKKEISKEEEMRLSRHRISGLKRRVVLRGYKNLTHSPLTTALQYFPEPIVIKQFQPKEGS